MPRAAHESRQLPSWLIFDVRQSMKDVIPAGFFEDALNPTADELVRWAYIKGAHYPPEMSQDWDLFVAAPANRDLLVRLACDVECPNRKFFLSCLYLMVGDAVRSHGQTWNLDEAASWLRNNHGSLLADVELFFRRATRLIKAPIEFDYENWCEGGYAYKS